MEKSKKIIFTILISLLITTACTNESKEKDQDTFLNQNEKIESIKKGHLDSCSDFTIEELVNNSMENIEWTIDKSDKGYFVYNVRGDMDIHDELENVLIQFTMDEDTIVVKDIEINKVSENSEKYQTLITDMCEISQDKRKKEENEQWIQEQEDKIHQIPDGYVTYEFTVNLLSTYGNSIMPGDYVDIYDASHQERLVEKAAVLQVLDKNGNHVFEPNLSEIREPNKMIVAVKKEDLEKLDSFHGEVGFILSRR